MKSQEEIERVIDTYFLPMCMSYDLRGINNEHSLSANRCLSILNWIVDKEEEGSEFSTLLKLWDDKAKELATK